MDILFITIVVAYLISSIYEVRLYSECHDEWHDMLDGMDNPLEHHRIGDELQRYKAHFRRKRIRRICAIPGGVAYLHRKGELTP